MTAFGFVVTTLVFFEPDKYMKNWH